MSLSIGVCEKKNFDVIPAVAGEKKFRSCTIRRPAYTHAMRYRDTILKYEKHAPAAPNHLDNIIIDCRVEFIICGVVIYESVESIKLIS